MRTVLQRLARQLVLVPVVAVASYFLMAMLPLTTESETKRQVSPELAASYRRDLGIGEPLGFLRPWEKLFRGERLGTSAQGITGDELVRKLSGSVGVGLMALPLALAWALGFALLRTRWRKGRWAVLGDAVPAVAFGTPVFIPALLVAPAVVERGHLLPELCAALVTSLWPGIFLGTLVGDALETELSRDYVRTALGKGLAPGAVLRRHVLPNVMPALLDAVGPVATALLAGSFAAERVLGLPYFGQLYVLAVLNKQVAVVVVATTTFASLLVVVSLGIEAVRYWVDPRSREARA
ncbi:ABC transporter permease subunit [Myxococcus sp. K15C18031901]|uniref:ABC transporter permease subunit n=1 Tax=Myxococcus dinghuensis TaxID=2906761 RepID=UPI0020A7CE27|nr:ABC transporter permease subunit [Myxococcus dinghuensis]MCP3103816.1 ABC transporter permease subunit [Myxococcus dinghuensis]